MSAAVGFFLGYFGAAFVSAPPKNPADTAAWAGAIGTVGTLIGTIWLATAAERRRFHEERGRAFVACVALRIPVSITANAVEFAIDALRDTGGGNYLARYAQLADALGVVAQWTDEEILPLLMLKGGVTANLAGARSSIQHCVTTLRRASDAPVIMRIPDLEVQILDYLETVRVSLALAQDECHKLVLTPPHTEYQ